MTFQQEIRRDARKDGEVEIEGDGEEGRRKGNRGRRSRKGWRRIRRRAKTTNRSRRRRKMSW